MQNNLFKGLALFTPGGDLVYCLSSDKQEFWHLNLCLKLQLLLGLAETPHFLIPGYTATVDRYFDRETNSIKTLAEVYPAVSRYQPLLNSIFDLGDFSWQNVPWDDKFSHPIIFESYRYQFPQLWESHNLIVAYELPEIKTNKEEFLALNTTEKKAINQEYYIFYLFVSEDKPNYNLVLKNVYFYLENSFKNCYTLKIIEIKDNLDLAETYNITAIPTLLKVSPTPIKKIVGTFDN